MREAGPDPYHVEYSHAELVDIDVRNALKAEVRLLMYELDEMNLPETAYVMEDDDFLEFLINNIRNEVISYQSFISKTINISYKKLTEKIVEFKKNYNENSNDIAELELKLREINEIKINAILEKNKNFDNINGERITPFFLKMVQGYQH
jgi:IMP cyclohydrolase